MKFCKLYRLIAEKESLDAQSNMSGLVEELGVCPMSPMSEASPALKYENIFICN